MVGLSPLWEQLWVVYIRRRSPVLSIRQLLGYHVDEVVRYLTLLGKPEADFSLYLGVDGLIKTDDNVVTRLPFEAALPGDDVVGVDLLPTEYFDTAYGEKYPSLRPAESLVF